MIKNVLIDLDDTILDFKKAERAALTNTLSHFNINATDKIISTYIRINSEHWKMLEKGLIDRDKLRISRFECFFKEINVNYDPKEATRCYEKQLSLSHYMIPGALDVIKNLSNNYDLYIVSNGTTFIQENRIKEAHLNEYFKDIFLSQSIGYNKPSIEFFDYCFNHINNFNKEETIIIGDTLSSDIQGGINAGIKTIWYNPKQKKATDILPTFQIEKLEELILLLKSI